MQNDWQIDKQINVGARGYYRQFLPFPRYWPLKKISKYLKKCAIK